MTVPVFTSASAMERFWIGIAEYAGADPDVISAGGLTIQSIGQDEQARVTWQGQAFIPLADLERIAADALIEALPIVGDHGPIGEYDRHNPE